MAILSSLFSTAPLTPHGFCLSWDPGLMALHVVSDALIGIAYFSIPVALTVFLIRRKDLAFRWAFSLFAIFILACGTTHFLSIWTLWYPDYVLDGVVKAFTAVASVLTAIALWPLVPRALALPSPTSLRIANNKLIAEMHDRIAAEAALRREGKERERAEAMLFQAQRMEAIGKITGGVAHDFNNLLAAVTTNLELLESRLGERIDLKRYTDRALAAATRGGVLTHQLLAFARRQTLKPSVVNVRELVSDMSELLRGALGPSIVLTVDSDDDLWPTVADQSQLASTMLNLAINARDAMPDGGSVDIALFNQPLTDADGLAATDAEPGDYVAISMTDTGIGMTEQVRMQAFEPFFTTKAVGKGSGLGLSQVYGFVMQSHGHVTLQSAEGKGTTVTIYLRRAE